MTKAIEILQDAYERCNRLSPGEVLNADDIAFGLRKLNLLVDFLSAKNLFLFKDVLTSNAQSGNITLGTGVWSAIDPGTEIISATANNLPLLPMSMEQYNILYQPSVVGTPESWAQDGFSTVYLWPVASGQTIKLQTRTGVADFADAQDTDYTLLAGWKNALGASLAPILAETIVAGGPTASMYKKEKAAMDAIDAYKPSIVNVGSYTGDYPVYPSRLF